MSDTEPQKPNLLGEFLAFAQEKNISVDCPACESEEGWNLFTSSGTHQVLPGGRAGDILIGSVGIDVLTMRCRNCGYIRMFELDTIRRIAKEKREGSSETDDGQ